MTASDEVNMNTLALLTWLHEPDVFDRWANVMDIWRRDYFMLWLKQFCLDAGRITPRVAQEVIDWPHVVDALFLEALTGFEQAESIEEAAP